MVEYLLAVAGAFVFSLLMIGVLLGVIFRRELFPHRFLDLNSTLKVEISNSIVIIANNNSINGARVSRYKAIVAEFEAQVVDFSEENQFDRQSSRTRQILNNIELPKVNSPREFASLAY